MSILKKIEPSDKVRKRVRACRDAGLTVWQDFIAGITEVHSEDELVLRCVRRSDSSWEMAYNDKFWDELERKETDAREP